MENKRHTNRLLAALSVSGLIALLLFSPCRVRNAIEDVLDLEQTEVFNKSKAAVNSNTCHSYEHKVVTTGKTQHSSSSQKSTAANQSLQKIDLFAKLIQKELPRPKDYQSFQEIPYYILYRSLKAYL